MHVSAKPALLSLLQPSETAELVERLEDAQMALGGMAANRYAAPFRDQVTTWLGKLGAVGEQARSAMMQCSCATSSFEGKDAYVICVYPPAARCWGECWSTDDAADVRMPAASLHTP